MTTLTGKSFSVGLGQAVGLSSLVSLSNPANDSLGAYWVEDLGGGSGHLTVGGATVSDSQWVQVGGNLSNVQYVGGWSNGTDTLDVCVYDNATGSYVYSPTFQATTFHVAPTLTGQSFSVSLGQAVGLSSLVSLSNPANDSLGAYWVEDLGGGSGHLTVGGTTVSDGQWVQVGGNLSNVQYVGGSSNGADTLDVCVYDNATGSYVYSPTFQATTYHVAPTLTGQNFSVNAGQAVGLSSFVSLSNPANDSLGAYWVEDLGGGSGHLTVGGTTVSDGQWVQVGGNLSNVQYVGGWSNGADALDVCVYDNATGSYVYSRTFQATSYHVAPTLTGQSFSVNGGQAVGLSSFVSLSNPANDSLGSYWVEDLGGGSGHLTVGGTAVSDGQWVQVGGNLSNVQYVGGWFNGADTLDVCVYDNATGSYVYSPTFQATTYHVAPTLTGQNFSVSLHQAVGLSSFVSLSNPANDSLGAYWVEDLGGGSGHLTVGGSTVSDGQWVQVGSNLGNVQYVGGSSNGADTLDVCVYDNATGSYVYSPTLQAATYHVAPTLTGQSFSVNSGQAVGLSSFVTLSNSANDSLGAYWVEDLGGGSGHLTVGGTAVSDGQWVQVGSNLSNVQYVGGFFNGADTLDVCVYDNATGSYVYSPTLQATTYHVAPTLTGQSFFVGQGQAVGLSSFVSLSDPANDSLGSYWVEDLGGGSGHLTVGGTTLSDGQWVQVGSNLSNVQYVGGSSTGADALDVCVYDNSTGSYVYSQNFQAVTFHVAPTLIGQSFSVSLGQAVGLSSFVSLSNSSNDSMGAYWVEDLGGGSGHLTVGGTTVSDGQWVQVGGNLSNVQYVGGSSNGADTLDVCVYDNTTGSYLYSQKFQATTYHVTPTLIGQSFSVSQGQAVGLSPFLSLSNPSNDSMGAYWVEDLGGGSGHLTVGGTAVSDNKWVQVGGNLSNVQYVGGSSNGADTLEICVYDNATGSYVYSQNFQATTNHVTPTLTGQSFSVNQGQTAGLSSFVSLSNSANDSMGAYWVEDLGGGSGHLTVGGTTVSDGQWVQVGSNLSSVQYVGGLSNGADTLEVCVYDNATGSYVYSPNFQATTTVTYNVLQPAAWNNGTWSAVNTSPSATWLYGATGTPQINAVNQGSLGDCWFLSSLEALDAMNSSRISNMISYVGNGIYGIKLYSGGVQQTVYVNDSLMSTVNNGNSNGNWASLIEKAYAAANGDAYATMDGNWPAVALQAFTGQASTDYTPSASTFNLAVSDLTGANAGNYEIELCSEYYDTPAGWKQFSSGSHAYAAVGYDQSTQCLVVANPWGQDSQSPYSGSAINTSYPSDMISSNGGSWYGMFEVSASAMSYFYKVTIDGPNVGPGSVASTGNQSAPLEQVTLNVPASSVGGGPGLEISGSSNAAISFSTNGGTLGLDASALFHGTLADFGTNDAIDLGDIAFDPGKTTLGYQANSASTGGMLLMGDGTHCAALALLGQYSAASFAASSDGHDGTLVTFVDHTTTPIPMLAQSHLHS